jgi:hypothetical protein
MRTADEIRAEIEHWKMRGGGHLLRKLLERGCLLVPTHISWRRADQLVRIGLCTLYPFHQRWQGRLDLSAAGRDALAPPPVQGEGVK